MNRATSLRMTAVSTIELRKSSGEARQGFGNVVVNHHHREQHQEHKSCLIDTLFDSDTDIAAHEAFNQKQQNYATIQNGDGKKVEDAEIQADGGSKREQRSPAFGFGGLSRILCNSNRSGDGPNRNLALH